MSEARHTGVGIVGLGFGRAVHLPAFRLLAPLGVEVVALCSRDAARARAAAEAEGVPRAYGDWRELVADPSVDLVAIATPPVAHAELALAAIAAGKAVFCEKPLARNEGEAEAMAMAAAAAIAVVNFPYRALPAFAAARAALADGALGRVRLAEVSWHLDSRLSPPAETSWKDNGVLGGGALASYGIHVLDYLPWLLGPVERVLARLDERERGGTRSDDACVMLLDHEIGTRTTAVVSLVSAGERTHRVVVYGERGRLVVEATDPDDHMRGFVARLEPAEGPTRELPLEPPAWSAPKGADGRIEPLAVHAAALVEALAGGRRAAPSFTDGLAAQRLLAATQRSAEAAAWVAL